MTIQEDSKRWNYEYKTLLLDVRLDMEQEFRSKKNKRSDLWERVLSTIKQIDPTFPFSRDDVHRKFLNLMVTYKRIKKRNTTLGEDGTNWDFYDRMDKIYGSSTEIAYATESSLEDIKIEDSVDLSYDYNEPCVSQATNLAQEDNPPPTRKRNRTDLVEFLRKENEADRKLLKEILICEKQKLKIEREKLEEIRKLREALTGNHNNY